jgi:hypothetical protein
MPGDGVVDLQDRVPSQNVDPGLPNTLAEWFE